MNRLKTLFRKPELEAFIAFLSIGIFSWPILTILETTRNGFIFFYFFAAWGFMILLLFLISISHKKPESEQAPEYEPES